MNLHRLDLVSLSLFNLVVRSGSISRGAELAHLAVGAASKRISDLEDAVGAELLERHSRGVTLTLAGEALHRHAQRILADVDLLAADLSDHAAGIVGVVRLVANTSAVTQFLPADLARFVAAHAGLRLELEELNSREAVLAVVDGRADLGIFAERTPAFGLQTLPYRRDRLVLVVPADHALAARADQGPIPFVELTDLDFVSLPAGTSLAQRLDAETTALGRRLRVRIHVRSFDAMCQMVAAGLGVAVLPDAAVQPHLRSMGLARLEIADAWVARELLLGVRDLTALARPVRLLLDHLVAGAAPG
ncbi:LysR substrate-binding domain-containing protein [Aquabacterium sp. J223]|uniref:LysR substrate-binding domain-containing protein n=1 Tax=Aquabacterium sp. J223 TaxID=2898431 RepID=UPI0021ADCC38|nr:LysR substrate-binding domain-containing protein [Aquabacterium sp. J223]UUX94720.1 LysR substrate-binding domain-containing protein [Aquabacterium sp. J223]